MTFNVASKISVQTSLLTFLGCNSFDEKHWHDGFLQLKMTEL